MLGFQSFWTARRTLAGVEAMAMLTKGQVRGVPANHMPTQWAFVHQVFGLAARVAQHRAKLDLYVATQQLPRE
jgi:hypothetical protein